MLDTVSCILQGVSLPSTCANRKLVLPPLNIIPINSMYSLKTETSRKGRNQIPQRNN